MNLRITAVVVTYNKFDLLKDCLEAIQNQSYPCTDIVLIDNGGFPETQNIVKNILDTTRIHHRIMKNNVGGAGGFYQGIIDAQACKPDYIWILDDDTIASVSALKNLVVVHDVLSTKHQIEPAILASNVLWKDGSQAIMNVPRFYSDHGSDRKDIRKIVSSSFVSMLVSNDSIKNVGLPIKDFFIWGDDVEFSRRISQHYKSFWVKNSVVTHMMAENIGPNIRRERSSKRMGRYFYEFRNRLYISRKYDSKLDVLKRFSKNLCIAIIVLFKKDGFNKCKIVLRGTFAGIVFNPKVNHL